VTVSDSRSSPEGNEAGRVTDVRLLHVLFKVADAQYVVPAADVLQMESFTSATKVPGAPSYVAGLVLIRGRVVPVIDVRARFGLPPVEPTLDSRIVVISEEQRTVGLLVDSAREVVQIAPAELKPPPDVLMGQSDGFVKSVAKTGDRLLMLVDCRKIIGEGHVHGE
jgi:purine-binding chemotaxis protein CheW